MAYPVARQKKDSTSFTVINQPVTGSVGVGAATQTETKAYSLDDNRPKLGGRYTAALEQNIKANRAARMADLIQGLTVADTSEKVYTIQRGDTLFKIAWEHRICRWQEIYHHPKNKNFKAKHSDPNLIHPGDKIWICNKVPFPTSAYVAGQQLVKANPPTQYGLISGNDAYEGTSLYETDIPSAKFDAGMMENALKARGYQLLLKPNCPAVDLSSALNDLLENGMAGGSPPKAGDEIFFHYSGHGEPEGLRCAQDGPAGLFKVTTLVELARKALAKKLHFTISLDSCHSGAVADGIRSLAIETLAKDVPQTNLRNILEQADRLQKMKDQLASVENHMGKLYVEYGHGIQDVERAKKSGDPAKLKAAQQGMKQFEADFPKKNAENTAQVKDAWFDMFPKIRNSLQGIQDQGGPDFFSKSSQIRYGMLQRLMRYAKDRKKFESYWDANNNYSHFRPEELDDLDDIINATLGYVRNRI